MGWFTSKYLGKSYTYYTPERYAPGIARERKLAGDLARNTKLQQRALERATRSVSGNQVSPQTRKFLREALEAQGPKPSSTLGAKKAALLTPGSQKGSGPSSGAGGGQKKAAPTGSDKRRYDPTGKDYASTIYGTIARTALRDRATVNMVRRAVSDAAWTSTNFIPRFLNPNAVVPCVKRHIRREVMFATKKAGRGYATKKRRTWDSGVPC